MITISAFADEIAQDLKTQMNVCENHSIKSIDVRSIDDKNVSALTLSEVAEYRKQLEGRGFTVPCIGSPLGKIKISDNFDAHMELLRHCCEIAKAFGTSMIRIFSFYPSEGMKIENQRGEVMERMAAMIALAERADCILMHENEKAIYGAKPDGVKDLFSTFKTDNFKSIFDPANYIEEEIAPYDDGWMCGLAELTDFFHVKDKDPSQSTCCPAGEGDGQFAEIFADLKKRNWSGYMTLEPHMKVAGHSSGFTGEDMFAKAVEGLKKMCDQAGLEY